MIPKEVMTTSCLNDGSLESWANCCGVVGTIITGSPSTSAVYHEITSRLR